MITQQQLKEVLEYDPLTGVFTFLVPRGRMKAGSVAGSANDQGYTAISLFNRNYRASRLAWLYMHGTWPTGVCDHINGIRDDDRIANLRDVSQAANCQNRRSCNPGKKSSRFLGVTWDKCSQKWVAQIQKGSKKRTVGCFRSEEDAYQAYVAAKREWHPGCTL